jgi:hypothetical protein
MSTSIFFDTVIMMYACSKTKIESSICEWNEHACRKRNLSKINGESTYYILNSC